MRGTTENDASQNALACALAMWIAIGAAAPQRRSGRWTYAAPGDLWAALSGSYVYVLFEFLAYRRAARWIRWYNRARGGENSTTLQ